MNMEQKSNSKMNDVAKELLSWLYFCDENIVKKIPDVVLQKIANLAADSLIDVYIKPNKGIEEQNLSNECLDAYKKIYEKYICK